MRSTHFQCEITVPVLCSVRLYGLGNRFEITNALLFNVFQVIAERSLRLTAIKLAVDGRTHLDFQNLAHLFPRH